MRQNQAHKEAQTMEKTERQRELEKQGYSFGPTPKQREGEADAAEAPVRRSLLQRKPREDKDKKAAE